MATDMEIERALAAVAKALNENDVESLSNRRVHRIITDALGEDRNITLDDGGGLHDESGARVGMIRRTPSGEWITERQNPEARNAHAPIPSQEKDEKSLMRKLKPGG